MRFFRLFSKTTLTILLIFSQDVEENDTDQLKKTAHQKLSPFSRYSSTKFGFSSKRAKMGSKDRPISRERKTLRKIWFDILNQRKILFHPCFIRFCPAPRLQGLILTWKWLILTLKICVFSPFSEISSWTTGHIPMKFGTMIVLKYTKTVKKTAHPYLS